MGICWMPWIPAGSWICCVGCRVIVLACTAWGKGICIWVCGIARLMELGTDWGWAGSKNGFWIAKLLYKINYEYTWMSFPLTVRYGCARIARTCSFVALPLWTRWIPSNTYEKRHQLFHHQNLIQAAAIHLWLNLQMVFRELAVASERLLVAVVAFAEPKCWNFNACSLNYYEKFSGAVFSLRGFELWSVSA